MSSTLARITMISSILAATAIPALAATEERGDSSEFMVWGFLGICALIIVSQVVPLIRNLKKHSNVAAEQSKAVKLEKL